MGSVLENIWTSTQTCDLCSGWHKVVQKSGTNPYSNSEVVEEDWVYKIMGDPKPIFFTVRVELKDFGLMLGERNSLLLDVCNSCVRFLGLGDKGNDWVRETMSFVRPEVVDETESEVHNATPSSGEGSSGDS